MKTLKLLKLIGNFIILKFLEIIEIFRNVRNLEFFSFNATFKKNSAISWRPVLVMDEAGSTRGEPPTMCKQQVNFITCSCESNASFVVI